MGVFAERKAADLGWLSQHDAHVFHHHARFNLGKVLRRQHLAQRRHFAIRPDEDHAVGAASGLAIVFKDADASSLALALALAVSNFLWLAKLGTHVGLGGDA